MHANWHDLNRELNQWQADGLEPTFWWRDDDVTHDSSALQSLLDITARANIPLALAAIPDLLDAQLPSLLARHPQVSLLQHGFRHVNHAPPDQKKAEFGAHREPSRLLDDLVAGRRRMQTAFGNQFVPVLVPPWNRYSSTLPDLLDSAELIGFSAMWARPCATAALLQVNTHIDPVAWRGDRGFAGLSTTLEQVISHLRLRREHPACRAEPTGLLTHHADHTAAVWSFCSQLIEQLAARPEVRWLGATDIWRRQ